MEIGKINTLTVVRIVSPGAILADDANNEVLLPGKFIPEDLAVDDTIDVFVSTDSEDRIVATTQTPLVMVGDFAMLEVVDVTEFGAFVYWGLDKDLFISIKNQTRPLEKGDVCFVTPYCDEYSNRMCGTTKLGFIINNDTLTVAENDTVEVIVYSISELGYTVIVNKKHWGLIYKNEVFRKIAVGDVLSAYVKTVRADNKLDLVLQKSGREQADTVSDFLLEALQKHGGFIALTDKSSADDIYDSLHVSKRNFKQAVGNLYKQRKITIEDNGIRLI